MRGDYDYSINSMHSFLVTKSVFLLMLYMNFELSVLVNTDS